MREQASDRLKTPEEVAKQARSKLEHREAQRLKRMHGEIELESADELDLEETQGGYAARRKRRKKAQDRKKQQTSKVCFYPFSRPQSVLVLLAGRRKLDNSVFFLSFLLCFFWCSLLACIAWRVGILGRD